MCRITPHKFVIAYYNLMYITFFSRKDVFVIHSPGKSPHFPISKENIMNYKYLISLSLSSELHPVSHKLIVAKVIMHFSTNTRHMANYKLNGNLIKTSYGDPQWELSVWKKKLKYSCMDYKPCLPTWYWKSKRNIICWMFLF